MKQGRRLGAESSETRAKLIDAAATILKTEGSGAVTARRLAEVVGLQRHIVHYYFGTIEEVLLAVLRRDTDHAREWMTQALETGDPLRVIWDLASRASVRVLEFSALATRHATIREEFKHTSEEFREMLTRALDRYIATSDIVPTIPNEAVTIALQSIAYTLSIERLLGIERGHAAMKASLHALLGVEISAEQSADAAI